MAYEFSYFDSFIHTELPACKSGDPEYVKEYPKKITSLRAETEAVRINLQHTVCRMKNQREIRHYIRLHQMTITILADRLTDYIAEREIVHVQRLSKAPSLTNLVKVCYQCLESLLEHIDIYYHAYFCQEVPVPAIYVLKQMKELKEREKAAEQMLLDAGADRELVHLALSPLQEFFEYPVRTQGTYYLLSYFRLLLRELERLPEAGEQKFSLSTRLFIILGYLNHNSHQFFCYCRNYCLDKIAEEDTIDGKLLAIQRLLTYTVQYPHKPGVALRVGKEP